MSLSEPNSLFDVETKARTTSDWFRHVAQTILSWQPQSNRVSNNILVVSTMRSGSKLLCELLAKSGLMGAPQEYLNPMLCSCFVEFSPKPTFIHQEHLPLLLVPKLLRRPKHRFRSIRIKEVGNRDTRHLLDLDAYLQFLKLRTTTPNGVFCCNVHVDHLIWLQMQGFDLKDLGFDRIVYLRRRDRLAQAISLAVSNKYDFWTSVVEDCRPRDATVSRSEVIKALADIEFCDQFVESQLSNLIDCEVCYEDIVSDYQTISNLLVSLKIAESQSFQPIQPSLRSTTAACTTELTLSMRAFLSDVLRKSSEFG